MMHFASVNILNKQTFKESFSENIRIFKNTRASEISRLNAIIYVRMRSNFYLSFIYILYTCFILYFVLSFLRYFLTRLLSDSNKLRARILIQSSSPEDHETLIRSESR